MPHLALTLVITAVALLAQGSVAPLALAVAPHPAALTSTLNVTASASPADGDAPFTTALSAVPSTGTAPYNYTWSFGDGTSLGYGDGVSHTYLVPGTYVAEVSVFDTYGEPGWANVTVTVAAPPLVVSLSADPSAVGVGTATFLEAVAQGGTPPYRFAWSGMPPGCIGGNFSSIRCVPSSGGGYEIEVTVTDSRAVLAQNLTGLVVTGGSDGNGSHGSGGGGAGVSLATLEEIGLVVAAAAVAGVGGGLALRRRRSRK